MLKCMTLYTIDPNDSDDCENFIIHDYLMRYYLESDDFLIYFANNTKECFQNVCVLNIIFKYASFNAIKYIIEKNTFGKDLIYFKYNHDCLIHYATRRNMEDFIIYLADKKVCMYSVDSEYKLPIHYICQLSSPKILKYVLNKTIMMEIIDKELKKPFDYIHLNKNPEMIKFVKENNIQRTDTLELVKVALNKMDL